MVRLDVCLETVFTNLKPEERIAEISGAGYNCAEMWFHDGKNLPAVAAALKQSNVTLNNVVVNSPDGSTGGFLVKKEDREKYLQRLDLVIEAARTMDCGKGITCTGNEVPGLSRAEMNRNVVETLSASAEKAEKSDFTLFLEPLNTIVDHAGYFLNSAKEAAGIIRAVNSPNVKLLYDVYHMQIMEGNLASFIERNIDIIGHFHSAGVPGRHELFSGEINYPFIIKLLERLNYNGCFGLEYFPAMADNAESLRKTAEYLRGE